jgi:hypothetical protein
VKTTEADETSSGPFAQLSARTTAKCPQLPELMPPHVRLRSSRKQLPHSHPLPAQALPDSLHGALRGGDTARTSMRKPGGMERLLPSARWWRPKKPKPTCLYSSPASAHAGTSGTAATRQAEKLVLAAEVALHGLVRGTAYRGKPTLITMLAGLSLGCPRPLGSDQ